MTVQVKLRLPVPEGRPGDVVSVSEDRANVLVNNRYAVFEGRTPATNEATPSTTRPPSQATPDTELPAHSAVKGEWERVAAQLGIDIIDDDGNVLVKNDIIALVEEATGASEEE